MDETMTYNDAVAVLQNTVVFGMNPSLDSITKMCEALGNPQRAYRCVQVAGSNGKSSTTRMIAALLKAHGLKTALYISPHLVKYSERMEIDGRVVSDALFAESISKAVEAAEEAGVEATEFELLTAGALWLFAREGAEVAVLECGLGGRWDATTVADSEVAVVTGIALEHTQILGDTVEKIAAEKACIIKEGATAVLAHGVAARDVFVERAGLVGASVVDADPASVNVYAEALEHLPDYQRANAATAIAAAEAFLARPLDHGRAALAFAGLTVPGRFEVLRCEPLLMIDAAHNPQSAQVLAGELSRKFVTAALPEDVAREQLRAGVPQAPTLLLGVLADKDVRGVVEALVPSFFDVVVTASNSPRSISARRLAGIVEEVSGKAPRVAPTIFSALQMLDGVPVLATGSITVAGEVKRVFGARIAQSQHPNSRGTE